MALRDLTEATKGNRKQGGVREPITATVDSKDKQPAPFLKWVGGKRSIIEQLTNRIPEKYIRYWEPFVGGGALFFELLPKPATISDYNLDLVLTYRVVQQDIEELIGALKKHQKLHGEEYYYKIRSRHHLDDPIEIAARMIYLNKTCYNGLWRVNKKGEFNTPIGSYSNPGICQEDNLRACSAALRDTTILHMSFSDVEPQAGDFCYLDPPYHPTTETSFTAYSPFDFTEIDQRNLADYCKKLHKNGVKFMLSNSNTPFIRDLYKSRSFKTRIVSAPRLVNCKPKGRSAVEELLVTNY